MEETPFWCDASLRLQVARCDTVGLDAFACAYAGAGEPGGHP